MRQSLKPGLHELIVHLGHDDPELQAVTVDHPDFGAAWRQRDFNAVTSPESKKALEENHIILVGWKDLKKLLEGRKAGTLECGSAATAFGSHWALSPVRWGTPDQQKAAAPLPQSKANAVRPYEVNSCAVRIVFV